MTAAKMGRRGFPLRVTIEGEGDAAVATIWLPEGPVRMDAADWQSLCVRFGSPLPSIYVRWNGRGKPYLGITPTPEPGKPKGKPEMLSRVILGAEAVTGKNVRYRDGDTFNLTRANLRLIDRKLAAAMATGAKGGG